MPVGRYFAPIDLKKNEMMTLDLNESHHLVRVCRAKEGEPSEVVNGKGVLATATVKVADARRASLLISTVQVLEKPIYTRALAAAFSKGSKLELIVEKGTEMGIDQFYFFPGISSEKKELSPAGLVRLQTHAISALKQSGRLWLPTIDILDSIESLKSLNGEFLFGSMVPTDPSLTDLLQDKAKNYIFITGPESGLFPKELRFLHEKLYAKPARLSQWTLRSETAALAASALLCQT